MNHWPPSCPREPIKFVASSKNQEEIWLQGVQEHRKGSEKELEGSNKLRGGLRFARIQGSWRSGSGKNGIPVAMKLDSSWISPEIAQREGSEISPNMNTWKLTIGISLTWILTAHTRNLGPSTMNRSAVMARGYRRWSRRVWFTEGFDAFSSGVHLYREFSTSRRRRRGEAADGSAVADFMSVGGDGGRREAEGGRVEDCFGSLDRWRWIWLWIWSSRWVYSQRRGECDPVFCSFP